jgi:hypothetical protein
MTLENEFWDRKKTLDNKSFLICPVRKAGDEEKKIIEEKVIPEIEKKGYRVHYPLWHTNQIDPIGYNICTENMNAIKDSVVVHTYLNPTSRGSAFDAGMLFYLQKPLYLANPESIKENLSNDFLTIAYEHAYNTGRPYSDLYDIYLHRKHDLDSDYLEEIMFDRDPSETNNDADFLFNFGMIFASGKKMKLYNQQRFIEYELANDFENIDEPSKIKKKEITKCFNKVLLCVDYVSNNKGTAEDFYKYYAKEQNNAYLFFKNTG